MNKLSAQEISKLTSQIRRDILRMVHGCKSGHPGGSLGCADFLAALYFNVMDHNPDFKMDGLNEDIFFLSNGHISPVFYSVLARAGYFPVEELKTFRKLNTRLQGHKIDNLIVTIDYNGQQIDGSTKEVMGLGDDIAEKVKAFGWEILYMDGHNMQNVLDTLAQAKAKSGQGKPIFIVMKTEMGYPVDFMMGSHKWHGVAPNDAELANALSQLPETIGDY